MRKLMVVLVAVAFLAGASFLYAEEHEGKHDNGEGKHALASDIQDIKRLLSEVVAELKKLNDVVAWETTSPTLYSLTRENNTSLKDINTYLGNILLELQQ